MPAKLAIEFIALLALMLVGTGGSARTAPNTAFADYFDRRRQSGAAAAAPAPPPWRPIGPAPASKPEVVAFYGEDAIVKGHPEDTCTPSFWLDFPPDTVTTIIMQARPHAHCALCGRGRQSHCAIQYSDATL
jgi:hypothetical protein